MTKIKYNVKGVERGGGNYEQPKPGLYEMEIVEANHRDTDGKNDIELVIEVTKNNNDFVGSRVWTYVGLGEASQWKLAELTDALGLPESGTIDTERLKGKKMKVKINADSYNGEYRGRAGRFAPLSAEADDVEPDADPDAEADDPDAEPEHITAELNDVELSTDPAYYEDWSDDDVFEEIENQGVKLGRKKKTRENVIALLIEKVRTEAGDGAEPDEADDESGDTYDDPDEWSDKALADEYKRRELDTIEGKKNREKVIAALRADDAGSAEDDPFAD